MPVKQCALVHATYSKLCSSVLVTGCVCFQGRTLCGWDRVCISIFAGRLQTTKRSASNLVDGGPTVIERGERLLDRNDIDRELGQDAGQDVGVNVQSRVVGWRLDGVVGDDISVKRSVSQLHPNDPEPKRCSSRSTYTL